MWFLRKSKVEKSLESIERYLKDIVNELREVRIKFNLLDIEVENGIKRNKIINREGSPYIPEPDIGNMEIRGESELKVDKIEKDIERNIEGLDKIK